MKTIVLTTGIFLSLAAGAANAAPAGDIYDDERPAREAPPFEVWGGPDPTDNERRVQMRPAVVVPARRTAERREPVIVEEYADDEYPEGSEGAPRKPWVRLEFGFAPGIRLRGDADGSGPRREKDLDADPRFGRGYFARIVAPVAGRGRIVSFGIGATYMYGRHEVDRGFDGGVDSHLGLVEAIVSVRVGSPALAFTTELGLGVGGVVLDYDNEDDEGGAAIGIRWGAGLQIVEHLDLRLDLGATLWGYPTETEGYGQYVLLGVGVTF